MIRCFRLFAITLAFLLLGQSFLSAQVWTYPRPSGMPIETRFSAMANGQNVPMWKADGSGGFDNPSMWAADGGRPIVNFAFNGSATVRVKKNTGFSSAEILPREYGIAVQKSGNDAVFTLDSHQRSKVVLRFNGDPNQEVLVFGDPPNTSNPSGNVTTFEAGSYDQPGDELILNSNQTLHLKAGAVLRARVRIANGAKNVKIIGPGVLNSPYGGRLKNQLTVGNNCENIEIRDIFLTNDDWPDFDDPQRDYNPPLDRTANWYLDAHQLVIKGFGSKNITVRNLKTSNDYFTSDAVTLVGCSDVLVEDCFFISADNAIVVGGHTTTRDCTLRRNVVHQNRVGYSGVIYPQGGENANAFAFVEDILIDQLYVTRTQGTLLAANHGNTFTRLSNFEIRNVYVEELSVHQHPQASYHYSVGSHVFSRLELPVELSAEISLENIHFPDDNDYQGWIGEGWTVNAHDLHFGGRLVTNVADSFIQQTGGELNVSTSDNSGGTTPDSMEVVWAPEFIERDGGQFWTQIKFTGEGSRGLLVGIFDHQWRPINFQWHDIWASGEYWYFADYDAISDDVPYVNILIRMTDAPDDWESKRVEDIAFRVNL